jgi:hypothetical protein
MDISQEKNDNIEETQNEEEQNPKQKPKTNLKKDDLIIYIKEWIKIDNDIINLKTQVKQKTTKKKELTESLVNVMKVNNIDCFDINGGALIYKQKKTKRTISGKFLLTQLEEHYKDQPELAKELTKKVLENRINVVKDEITRKIDKLV